MTFPNDNLPPQSRGWKQAVEKNIGALFSSADRSLADTKNALAGVSASIRNLTGLYSQLADQQAQISSALSQLSTQQGILNTAVSDISTTQTTLNATVATLGTTVSGLTTAQGQITTRLATPVSVAANATNSGGATLTTSYQNVCTVSISVPAGYTKAIIIANGTLACGSSPAGSVIGTGRISIAGNTSSETSVSYDSTSSTGIAAVSFSQLLSSVSGSVSISLQGRTGGSTLTTGNSLLTASAFFLK